MYSFARGLNCASFSTILMFQQWCIGFFFRFSLY
jgi:hypothetical protein